MRPTAVVTGAGAGVGRATVHAFAEAGYDVGLIGRDPQRLEAVAAEVRGRGGWSLVRPADVADAAAVEGAAAASETELGPIAVWVNNAMARIFAPVSDTTPEEFRRGTEVTDLGTVHGTLAALKYMRPRRRGAIVNVGSALAYRSVPLQAIYCGAKSAIRGFTENLRSELIHDRAGFPLSMVRPPAINTPQFDWARNTMGRRAQPVPPIYQPEVPARATLFAATRRRREVWAGFATVIAILANRIAPRFADHYLAQQGYASPLTDQPAPAGAPGTLDAPVTGAYAAHGRFGARARTARAEMVLERIRGAVAAALVLGSLVGLRLLARRLKV